MLVLCHYRLGGISLILATSDLLRSWHAGSTVECHLSFIENTFFLWTCSIPIMLSVILAMSWHEILEWSFAAFYFPSQSTWHVFFFLFFFVVVSFATLGGWWVSFFPSNGWWFPWPFPLFNLNCVSLHLGWLSDLFRAYALNVRSEFPFLFSTYFITRYAWWLEACLFVHLRKKEVVCLILC